MLDIFFTDLRDVNKTVLMDADIDECAEIDDIAHDALEDLSLIHISEPTRPP